MLDIPKTIKISGIDYLVKATDEVILLDNARCYGQIDYEDHVIRIDNNLQDKQGTYVTLLHEILHGICNDRDIDLGENEEKIIEQLSKGLYQVLKENDLSFK